MAKKQIEEKVTYEFPKYSNEDLRSFEEKIEKYRINKTTSKGENIAFYDDMLFMKDYKIVNSFGAIFVSNFHHETNSKGDMFSVCDYPTRYEIFRDKLEQLYNYQTRKNFARKEEEKRINSLIV